MEWNWLVDWIKRMADSFGGSVYDTETGKTWDWGQAICREVYGPNWMHEADYLAVDIEDTDSVPDDIVSAALAWERGNWPEWAGLEIYRAVCEAALQVAETERGQP